MNNKTALIIVDVQVGMFSSENQPYNGEKLIENISYLLKKARSSNTTVIYIQHFGRDDGALGKGKPGWEIHPKILPLENEKVISKQTPDSFYNTNLQEELEKANIGKLVVVGMQTEFCIDTFCRRAFSLDYDTTLVRDGHSTFNSKSLPAQQIIEHHNRLLKGRFVTLKNTDEIDF